MQDIYIETEALTLPLRFAMVASRVAAVLRGVREGRPLDNRAKKSLHVAGDLLECAAKGGTVLRDRSMDTYSAEAMSAYHLVEESKLPGADTRDPAALVQRLKKIADGLRALSENRPSDAPVPLETLESFFTSLTRRSLAESAGPPEEVLRIG